MMNRHIVRSVLLSVLLINAVLASAQPDKLAETKTASATKQCVPAPQKDGAYHLLIKDHQFVPKQLVVATGKPIQLVVTNKNTVPSEFESTSLHQEKIVFNGSSSTVYIGALTSGKYDFFDDFHHASKGALVACNP